MKIITYLCHLFIFLVRLPLMFAAVWMPRLLPCKWAQALLIRIYGYTPRQNWLETNTSRVYWRLRQPYVCSHHVFWDCGLEPDGFINVSAIDSVIPFETYLLRCSTPQAIRWSVWMDEELERLEAEWAAQEAEDKALWAAELARDRERQSQYDSYCHWDEQEEAAYRDYLVTLDSREYHPSRN